MSQMDALAALDPDRLDALVGASMLTTQEWSVDQLDALRVVARALAERDFHPPQHSRPRRPAFPPVRHPARIRGTTPARNARGGGARRSPAANSGRSRSEPSWPRPSACLELWQCRLVWVV